MEETYTRRGRIHGWRNPQRGHTQGAKYIRKEHAHGELYKRRHIYIRKNQTKKHTHGGDINTKGTYIERDICTHEGDMSKEGRIVHTEGHIHGSDIQMKKQSNKIIFKSREHTH